MRHIEFIPDHHRVVHAGLYRRRPVVAYLVEQSITRCAGIIHRWPRPCTGRPALQVIARDRP
jgi:hypothetical protein